MNGSHNDLKDYVKGQKVEINMKVGGWIKAVVLDKYSFDYGMWIKVLLEDGRPALCGNASCIRFREST
jgi:hypothetical protein